MPITLERKSAAAKSNRPHDRGEAEDAHESSSESVFRHVSRTSEWPARILYRSPFANAVRLPDGIEQLLHVRRVGRQGGIVVLAGASSRDFSRTQEGRAHESRPIV